MDTAEFNTEQVSPLGGDGARQARSRNGQRVKVRRPLDPSRYDRAETGPMFEVEFPDGLIADVFGDELTRWDSPYGGDRIGGA